MGKKSTTIIVLNSRELCNNLINSLFIENEENNQDMIKQKKELCSSLDKYMSHFTDLSMLGNGENIRELAYNTFKLNIDERQRFGDWYKRPLTVDQIDLAAIDVSCVFACYDELFDKI